MNNIDQLVDFFSTNIDINVYMDYNISYKLTSIGYINL